MSQSDMIDPTLKDAPDNSQPLTAGKHTADSLLQSESTGDVHGKRVRKFTEKKYEEFQSRVKEIELQIQNQWIIVSHFINFKASDDPYITENELTSESKKCFDLINHYLDYLQNCYTEESLQICQRVRDDLTLKNISVERAMIRLERAKAVLEEVSLQTYRLRAKSKRSNRSIRSNRSSRIAEDKRAKAEAARAEMEFLEEEAILKKKALDVETELRRVTLKKEAAIADAEADALEGNIGTFEVKSELAKRHLEEQRQINGVKSSKDPLCSSLRPDSAPFSPSQQPHTEPFVPSHQQGAENCHSTQHQDTATFYPSQPVLPPPAPCNPSNDFVIFMLKKEMLSKRKWEFDDTAESYQVWKSNFMMSMRDMAVDEADQVDLLIRYLGNQSKRSAIRIRNANPHNPLRALRLIWERLDECYGTPDMLESALKSRINNFPKITYKDPKRLYELTDLLSEVASLKEDPVNASQFAYYDSSAGVKPIVCKLPPDLQEKWTSRAAKYQTTHGVVFPPFSEFLQFVKEMARIRSNPSFMYESQQTSVMNSRAPVQNVQHISTKMTTAKEEVFVSNLQEKVVSCPYHESTNQTLNRCRAFRSLTINKRRQFLRDNKVCMKCCEIERHDFKKCSKKVTCSVCQKEHPTALHEDRQEYQRPAQPRNSTVSHGGESTLKASSSEMVSACTMICGQGFSGKSCAKIQLAWIYPKNDEELVMECSD